MTDPEEREPPTLEDEIFGTAPPAPSDVPPRDFDPLGPLDPLDPLDTGPIEPGPDAVESSGSELSGSGRPPAGHGRTASAGEETATRSEPPHDRPGARARSAGAAAAGRFRPSWESGQPLGCRDIGLTTAGFVSFVAIDSIMMYAPFRADDNGSLAPQMITLLVLAFGLGGLMIWQIRGAWRPVGTGLMLGWLFLTLISAGFLTGLNP